MLSPAEESLLDALKSELVRRYGARLGLLRLFGSRARGGGREDSDLDVLVGIRDLTREERRQIIDAAADLSVETGLVLSPLVVDVDAAGRARIASVSLRGAIDRDGIAL